MSYVQIEIGPLKKDDKGVDIPGSNLRGLKFNQFAYVEYITIVEGKTNPIIHSYALIYSGLYANCIVKRQEPDFTFEQVCEWCEKMKPEDVMKVQDAFKSTLPEPDKNFKKKVAKNPVPQKNTKKRALK